MADSFFEARIEVLEEELERTKKQLDIAVNALKKYTETTETKINQNKYYTIVDVKPFCDNGLCAKTALAEIKELNK